MNFFNAIRNWLKRIIERSKATRAERCAKKLENIVCESINVIEFNGNLYIAHDGAPIVRVDDLKSKVPDVLAKSREDYLEWENKFNI